MPLSPATSRGGGGSGASLLVSTTLGVAGPTLSVAGISAAFSMLMVVLGGIQSTVAATSDTITMTFNSDTGAAHYGAGNANSTMGVVMAGFQASIRTTMPGTSAGINAGGGMTMFIPNYTNAANQIGFHGTQTGRIAAAGTNADFPAAYFAGIWNGGAAIVSIQCGWITGPNFVAGAFLNVYGF